MFRSLFRGREDVYAVRWENRKGKSGYSPACANEWDPLLCRKPCAKCKNSKHIPISDAVIRDHLLGKCTVGIYPLLLDETCWFLAADFDKKGWQEDVRAFLAVCREFDIPAAVERSRSGQGARVWAFFEEAIPAELLKHTRHVIVLRGGMGKKQRAAAYEQIESVPAHETRAILATGRYAGEGFDDERLDTLFLAMPISWRGTLQQYVGRLHRACPGKHDVRVYDCVDRHVPVLMRMFSKRLKGYRAMVGRSWHKKRTYGFP